MQPPRRAGLMRPCRNTECRRLTRNTKALSETTCPTDIGLNHVRRLPTQQLAKSVARELMLTGDNPCRLHLAHQLRHAGVVVKRNRFLNPFELCVGSRFSKPKRIIYIPAEIDVCHQCHIGADGIARSEDLRHVLCEPFFSFRESVTEGQLAGSEAVLCVVTDIGTGGISGDFKARRIREEAVNRRVKNLSTESYESQFYAAERVNHQAAPPVNGADMIQVFPDTLHIQRVAPVDEVLEMFLNNHCTGEPTAAESIAFQTFIGGDFYHQRAGLRCKRASPIHVVR